MKQLFIFCILVWQCCHGLVLFAQNHPIGTTQITYQDPARANRNISTYLYYPATSAGSNTPVAMGSFPIIVIGHGFTMNYQPYIYLADTLVPAGYILAIPNTETGFAPSHTNFGLDLSFLVAKLYAENTNSASIFYQHVSPASCVMGHSMGGGCTMLAAQNNSNVTCTATLALAETTPSAIAAAANVSVPSLVFSGSEDCVTPPANHQIPAFNALPACKALVTLTGGGHCNFVGNSITCNIGEMSCNPGGSSMAASLQRAITVALLRPWLDRFLKGNSGAGAVFNQRLNQYIAANQATATVACAVLPVELLVFRGKATESGSILLQWETASEDDLEGFEIERSLNGTGFEPIGYQPAKGEGSSYTYNDQRNTYSTHYYRLKMKHNDGQVVYSNTIAIDPIDDQMLHFFPNPFESVLQVEVPEGAHVSRLEMTDVHGRLVWSDTGVGETTHYQLDLQSHPSGVYWIKCFDGLLWRGYCVVKQ